jgi:hypothetical protein
MILSGINPELSLGGNSHLIKYDGRHGQPYLVSPNQRSLSHRHAPWESARQNGLKSQTDRLRRVFDMATHDGHFGFNDTRFLYEAG